MSIRSCLKNTIHTHTPTTTSTTIQEKEAMKLRESKRCKERKEEEERGNDEIIYRFKKIKLLKSAPHLSDLPWPAQICRVKHV